MASGLFGLLDDVAALAKLAAASLDDIGAAAGRATTKAAGVVIDDAAVTPQYVHGLAAERELPIIIKIAKGSLRNKLLFIVPAALLLSEFLPFLLTPILMLGGAYLCYEAVHKIWGAVSGHEHGHAEEKMKDEDEVVSGAIRTDLILSAEIMVIALTEVESEPLLSRAVILVIVALGITLAIYGVVALIVKMDDVGLNLAERGGGAATQRFGRQLVAAMPKVLAVLSVVGTAAMLWVGGHIELVGLHDLSLPGPYAFVHDLEESVKEATGGAGGALAWLLNTVASAILGLIVGGILVGAQMAWARRGGQAAEVR